MPRLSPLRAGLAALSIAVLLAAPVFLLRDPDALRPASVAPAGGISVAPFVALAILGAMSCLVLIVAFRPAK